MGKGLISYLSMAMGYASMANETLYRFPNTNGYSVPNGYKNQVTKRKRKKKKKY